ncbi:zinc finger A20 and AN1 domain-containing stress-associated protein 11-like [Phoenix dactylifera]|uniref:Zinc finger A20 and AN1 domain-containing stress-associated protein 11-like n=1 Tax=Phoenix dactylifera TaxID=42345 RepID=A0A8B8ZPJ8_PHODC|nr:zinc finger A20 and AN1 domain-containing stress-associated protein 11-like [Phoenix dactylifera]XP_038973408.1 zinc finger A20 and AN1 domain-containing stress-associated protein 11-like [Phoenix dactylifera]
MAQREKELQVPETLTLCVNNCGFYGNPATNNMCQACFQAAGFASPSPPSRSSHEKASSAPARSLDPAAEAGREGAEGPAGKADAAAAVVSPARRVSRCAGCRKRVGLTGFRCRCGKLFCAQHRYSDRHDCSFDYKAAGREAIARENPVVRAAKIVKI